MAKTQPDGERRSRKERRSRTDVAYVYEITLDPKPDRRTEGGDRRKTRDPRRKPGSHA